MSVKKEFYKRIGKYFVHRIHTSKNRMFIQVEESRDQLRRYFSDFSKAYEWIRKDLEP